MKKLLFILTTTFIPLLQLSAQSPIKEIGKTKPTLTATEDFKLKSSCCAAN
jgi:hypothetical protein